MASWWIRRSEAILRSMAHLGPRVSAEIWANTARTALADARTRRRDRTGLRHSVTRPPGRLVSVEAIVERRRTVGAHCRFTEAELELRFAADDVVRVSWGPDPEPPRWAAPAGASTTAPPTGVRVRVRGNSVGTGALTVEVGADGGLRYLAGGTVARREQPPLRRGPRRSVRWLLRPGEQLAGLGEQSGPLGLSGTHRLWNTDPTQAWGTDADPLYCVIPVLVGLHQAGAVLAFYDNAHDGTVRVRRPVGGDASVEVTFESGMLRQYVAVGRLPEVLDRYAGITGRPAMPPRWALGYHQSRWGYRDQAAVQAVSEGFRAERLPLSAVHLDIDHMDGYRVFTTDPGRFGDLSGLTAALADRGTAAVAIVDPGVKADPRFDVYAHGSRYFVQRPDGRPVLGVVWPGAAVFPDFTSAEARRWWGDLYPRLLDLGITGVWHDMNEPTSFSFTRDRTLPLDARHDMEGMGGDHRDCHNVYGLCMARAGADALARHRPDRRPFVLSRSGWAGVQATAWTWTGDTRSTWESLRQQIATVVNLGLSGAPFTGPDVGGFAGTPEPELYVRWLEMAVFMPLCRTHCIKWAPGREPWCFDEPYRSAIGRLVRARYRLLPYLYAAARDAAVHGWPLVRPAGWPESFGTPDSFLVGDALLIAPVLQSGRRHRTVSLPEGQWVPWSLSAGAAPVGAGRPPACTGRVTLPAPLGAPVVMVRAGSIVTLDDGWHAPGSDGDDGRLDPGHAPRRPSFHVFPDAAGRAAGTGYDDAGDGDGPWRIDRLRLCDGVLAWEREGGWPAPGNVRVVGATVVHEGPAFDTLAFR